MTCLYKFQGNTAPFGIALPGTSGVGDVGSAIAGSVIGPLTANPRLDVADTTLANGRYMKVLRAYDSAVGGDLTYWIIAPSDKPYPAPSAYTGPWSMRMYVRLPTPSGTLTFMNVMQGATVNVAFVRLISTNRITRWGGNTVTLANANGMYRIELQADPNRTAKLVWRIYYEDGLVPIGGTQDSAVTNVTWDQIRIGSLNSGLFLAQFEWGDIEIHDDYDLGGQFRSNPQDGVTPASATATGAPAWLESIPKRFNYSTSTGATVARGTPTFTSYTNVNYVTSGSVYGRQLDLYVPDGTPPAGGWPVVMWAHSGFFTEKDRSSLPTTWRDDLLLRGYAVSTVQYVKASKDVSSPYDSYGAGDLGGRYPSFIVDFKRAGAFLRDNASTYGINPAKIIASGYSAGGYIALAAAMTENVSADSASTPISLASCTAAGHAWGDGYTGTDPSFLGCMVFAAPVDMDLASAWDPTHSSAGSVIRRIAYRAFQGLVLNNTDAPSYPRQAIPSLMALSHPADMPPVAYIRGESDYLIHWEHLEALDAAMASEGVNLTTMFTPNNHDQIDDIYDIEQQAAWLDALAYPPDPAPDPDPVVLLSNQSGSSRSLFDSTGQLLSIQP